ncbi:putative tRNA 2'-phosphotransferase [Rhodotorula sp. JG-1b]|nr:putative tRNA 2'-phosphotransferase [Rhodotorula sp. JG-1b]
MSAEPTTAPVASTSTAAAAALDVPNSGAAPAPAPKVPKSARGRPTDDPDTRWSKTLSYILRHGAAKEGLQLRPDGFVRVEDLMKRPKLKGCDLETLERIVRDNAKQRFTLQAEPTGPDGADELWIRANQGHTVKVEALELKPVERAEQVPVMVHGTYYRLWPAIEEEGLKVMARNHIHCAIGLAGESGVISGMRANCDLFIFLDVAQLLADGIAIFTSTNNVVLTAGIDGVVPPKYFAKVVKKDGQVLVPPTDA